MKPILINRSSRRDKSFTIAKHQYPYFLKTWHFHTELELVLITESYGTRFIGDSIERFQPGDLVLIGRNLPHLWKNDKVYFEHSEELVAEAIVIHFRRDFAGENLLNTPEMKSIRDLIKISGLGIKFSMACSAEIRPLLEEIYQVKGFERLILFLRVLKHLSDETDIQMLSSQNYAFSFQKVENRRLDPVYNHIMTKFKDKITLDKVASLANMNPSAFSRYFKQVNKKSFCAYLNEVRVGYACKLLLEEQLTVLEICFASGFNNISNFNRQFKKHVNFSPTEYKAQFKKEC